MTRPTAGKQGSVTDNPRYLRIALALTITIIALAATGAAASKAIAHAVLLTTIPADGSAHDAAPSEIVLRFNERVVPVFVRVIGPDGRAITTPEAVRAIDTELRLRLPPDLVAGSYLVSYRVVSADAHPVSGSFTFAVGSAATTRARPPDSTAAREAVWEAVKVLLRLVQDIALMLAAGGALFTALIVQTGDRVPGLNAMIAGGAAVAVLAVAAGVGVQGALLTAAPASALLDPGTWRLGASSTTGTAAFVMVPALAVVALATIASSHALGRAVAALCGVVASASLALTGHGAAAGWPAQTAVAIHAVTVSYWLGSLWPLHAILRTRSFDQAVILVRRFSAVGVPAVAVLVAAGVGIAVTRIDSLAALVGSDYGRILLLKLAFVAVLVTVAVANRRHLTSALAAGSEGTLAALARNIRLELAFAGAILLTTAVLAHTPGPQASPRHDRHERTPDVRPGYAIATASRGRTLHLKVTPGRVGANELTLHISDADGKPLAPVKVTVALSLPAAGIEPLRRVPQRMAQGHYGFPRLAFPVAGRWRIRVDALINDFEKAIFTTVVPIQ